MQKPTPADLRLRSELLTELHPVTVPPADPDPLIVPLDEAVALVTSLTGRDLGLGGGEPVPPELVPLALRAVTYLTEQFAMLSVPKARRKAISDRNLRSFSAGPYSESYFGPGEAATAKVLHPDPELNALLWALATEAKRDEWVALWTGRQRPASGIQSFDWSRAPGGYGTSSYGIGFGPGPGIDGY